MARIEGVGKGGVGVDDTGDLGQGGNLGPGTGGGHQAQPRGTVSPAEIARDRHLQRHAKRGGNGRQPVVGARAAADGEETPDYAISFKLHENGFTRDLEMSYGEFSIRGRLVGFEVLEPGAACAPQ